MSNLKSEIVIDTDYDFQKNISYLTITYPIVGNEKLYIFMSSKTKIVEHHNIDCGDSVLLYVKHKIEKEDAIKILQEEGILGSRKRKLFISQEKIKKESALIIDFASQYELVEDEDEEHNNLQMVDLSKILDDL